MEKIIIVYPHGLGDCILATPAIRALSYSTNSYILFGMQKRLAESKIFDNNPYINDIFYVGDPWNDYKSYEIGMNEITKDAMDFARRNKYDKVISIYHNKDHSKIRSTFEELNLDPMVFDSSTEIYINENDISIADEIINNLGYGDNFGFVHSKTGVDKKNLPEGYGRKWLKKKFHIDNVIEPGETYNEYEISINVGFELMKRSKWLCLTDSVYYHAACAMNLNIDHVYFAKGPSVHDRVKCLHDIKEKVVYDLEEI
jgi:hypothetical protein